MNLETRRYFSYLLYGCLLVGAVILFLGSGAERVFALVLYALFAVLALYHNARHQRAAGEWKHSALFSVVELALALMIQRFDHTAFSGFPVMLSVSLAILTCPLACGVIFTPVALAASLALFYFAPGARESGFGDAGVVLLPRLFVVAALWVARYNIAISRENQKLAESLRQKTAQLEAALGQLQAYADELNRTAGLKAREALLRDLHDRLGHLLATASIGSQAALVLIDRDVPAARARVEMVSQQIQTAMGSLRDVLSGKTMDAFEREPDAAQLERLAQETEKRTGIPIELRIVESAAYNALPRAVRSFLYNALMEGLTNGIRHGGVSRFAAELRIADGAVDFRLKDDGKGFQRLAPGYGLTKIGRDAEKLGGRLEMNGSHGCEMRIQLPAGQTEEVMYG